MSYRPVYTDDARQDMADIAEYLSQFYPSTARNFSDEMKKKVRLLKDNQYMYPVYEDDPYFRRMVINDYLFFYNVNEDRHLIIIHRIIHSSRDINKIIKTARLEI